MLSLNLSGRKNVIALVKLSIASGSKDLVGRGGVLWSVVEKVMFGGCRIAFRSRRVGVSASCWLGFYAVCSVIYTSVTQVYISH